MDAKGALLFFVLCLSCSPMVGANLYGLVRLFEGQFTRSTLNVLQINASSGYIMENVVEGISYSRVYHSKRSPLLAAPVPSTYDPKNSIFYFADGVTSYVYGADVVNGVTLAPTVLQGIEAVSGILYDISNEQLVLTVSTKSDTSIITVPDSSSSPSGFVLSLTEIGIPSYAAAAIDANGLYSLAYATKFGVGNFVQFYVNSPQKLINNTWTCKSVIPLDIWYDETRELFIGIGSNFPGLFDYSYFEMNAGKCTYTQVIEISGSKNQYFATYDRKASTIYFQFYKAMQGNILCAFNSLARNYTTTALHVGPIALETPYSI